jgi:UDP-N-acetylglucosamine 2-epimerase (non-hydrolysing)
MARRAARGGAWTAVQDTGQQQQVVVSWCGCGLADAAAAHSTAAPSAHLSPNSLAPARVLHQGARGGQRARTQMQREVNQWSRAICAIVLLLASMLLLSGHQLPYTGQTLDQHMHLGTVTAAQHRSTNFVFFCGTRPEIIKMAPVVRAFKMAKLRTVVVFSGQHPDIAEPFRKFWQIDFDVVVTDVFRAGQALGTSFGKLVTGIERQLPKTEDDVWIVQGDTSTTLAAGMVAFFRGTPIVHLEAGLRTFNHAAPFPEEMNRRTLSLLASVHVPPTRLSEKRLLEQGVEPDRIFMLGNSGIDAARLAQPNVVPLADAVAVGTRLILVTLHRRENAQRLGDLYNAIGSHKPVNLTFIVPVHPNPAATKAARAACKTYDHLRCVSPLGYGETQWMLANSILVITDSGGLQEEATWYGRPVLVLREVTERTEAIHAGSSLLIPDAMDLRSVLPGLCRPGSELLRRMSKRTLPFGDGHTSERLVDLLTQPATQLVLRREVHMVAGGTNATMVARAGSTQAAPPMLRQQERTFNFYYCADRGQAQYSACTFRDTVDVVLTVFARNILASQLDAVAAQTKRVSHIWVVQNENHFDAASVVQKWKAESKSGMPVSLVHFDENSRYHGRFHVAYLMSSAEYVSVWDDDVTVGKGWVQHCIEVSRANGDALVGANGRSILTLDALKDAPYERHAKQVELNGQNDFVGHTWTLKREHLRAFFAQTPLTYLTGEDIQLSYALQQIGIKSWTAPQQGEATVADTKFTADAHASFLRKDLANVRQWLFCALLEKGLRTLKCTNCDEATVKRCIREFENRARSAIS